MNCLPVSPHSFGSVLALFHAFCPLALVLAPWLRFTCFLFSASPLKVCLQPVRLSYIPCHCEQACRWQNLKLRAKRCPQLPRIALQPRWHWILEHISRAASSAAATRLPQKSLPCRLPGRGDALRTEGGWNLWKPRCLCFEMQKTLLRALKHQAVLLDSTTMLRPRSQLPAKAVSLIESFPFQRAGIRAWMLSFPLSFFSLSACKDCISFTAAKSSTETSRAATFSWAWTELSNWVGVLVQVQHCRHAAHVRLHFGDCHWPRSAAWPACEW